MHPLEIRLKRLERNIMLSRILFAAALIAIVVIIFLNQTAGSSALPPQHPSVLVNR